MQQIVEPQDDWAIAIVHGIGTTSPLPLMTEVSDALRSAGVPLTMTAEAEIHRIEPHRHNLILHGLAGASRVRMGVAYWADIASTYKPGNIIATITGLITTIFSASVFALVAATPSKDDHWLMRAQASVLGVILFTMVAVLALVTIPLTLVTLAYSLSGIVGIYAMRTQFAGMQAEFISLSGFALCLSTSVIGCRLVWAIRSQRRLILAIFILIGVYGALVAILSVASSLVWVSTLQPSWPIWSDSAPADAGFRRLDSFLRDGTVDLLRFFNHPFSERFKLVSEIGIFCGILSVAQLVAQSTLLTLNACAFYLLVFYCMLFIFLGGKGIKSIIFATLSVFFIWFACLAVLWPENIVTSTALRQFLDDTRLNETVTLTGFNFSTFELETVTFGLGEQVQDRPGFMRNRLFADTYAIQWSEALFILFFYVGALLSLALAAYRIAWTYFNEYRDHRDNIRSPPRLIISPTHMALGLVLMATLAFVHTRILFEPFNVLPPSLRMQTWVSEITVPTEWINILVVTFLIAAAILLPAMRDGSKLVMDLVGHFTRMKSGSLGTREAIELRFNEAIDLLLRTDNCPHLVVIAHSQGTVITLDAMLRDGWMDDTVKRVKSLTILTFGSPLTHIYQEYFPQLYGPLRETALKSCCSDPRIKWINVYRIDDFVGTRIDESIPGFPTNVAAPAGGHTSYWREDVLRVLLARPEMAGVLPPQTVR